MKKSLIITVLAVSGFVSAFGQGQINTFANGASTLVTTNNGVNSGSAATTSKVELFYASASANTATLTADQSVGSYTYLGLGSGWEQMTLGSTSGAEAVTAITPVAGRFSQSQAIYTGLDITGGANVYLQVRAWTGGYANWAAAVAAYASNPGSVLLGWTTYQGGGVVAPWSNVTGDPNGTPATTGPFATGAGKFNGLVLTTTDIVGAPEPSTMALAGLGGAAMLLFRRRK